MHSLLVSGLSQIDNNAIEANLGNLRDETTRVAVGLTILFKSE